MCLVPFALVLYTPCMRPIVAIVGRPNVGKSTLFNRLVGFHKAIVESVPGVTRDLNYADVDRFARPFTLIDTGGFEPAAEDRLMRQIAEQCHLAVDEADCIIFVLDGKEGVTPIDREIANILRQQSKRVVYAVNKIDSPRQEDMVYDFYALGADNLYPISAQHNLGIETLMEEVIAHLPPIEVDQKEGEGVRIAVVGRPNVGKSSLVNRLLGYGRVIVHEEPGTTRDAIDTTFSIDGKRYTIMDTAGIRRKGRIGLRLERYAVVEAIKGIERSDVALLVLDAKEGARDQDARIGGLIHDKGKGGVVVVNKWDLVGGVGDATAYAEQVRAALWFFDYTPIVFASALTGEGVDGIIPMVDQVYAQRHVQVPTPELNRWLKEAIGGYPPPMWRSRRINLSYATQISSTPPTFLIFTNYPAGVNYSYRRYLTNQLRARFGFFGNPIRLIFKKK